MSRRPSPESARYALPTLRGLAALLAVVSIVTIVTADGIGDVVGPSIALVAIAALVIDVERKARR